eukprot:SAG31_NODE_4136_length_3549_cov_13.673333_4_plen_46_part_00
MQRVAFTEAEEAAARAGATESSLVAVISLQPQGDLSKIDRLLVRR